MSPARAGSPWDPAYLAYRLVDGLAPAVQEFIDNVLDAVRPNSSPVPVPPTLTPSKPVPNSSKPDAPTPDTDPDQPRPEDQPNSSSPETDPGYSSPDNCQCSRESEDVSGAQSGSNRSWQEEEAPTEAN